MAGLGPSGGKSARTYEGRGPALILPAWIIIGIFLVAPIGIMLVYSFLTKEFRGGVIWQPTLAAYDQFFFDRGLFGDDPPKIEWTYILIFWLAQSGLFPSISNIPPGAPLAEKLYRTFLPALTLTLVVTAHMMRMTRAAIINLLASPYIEMARLKGMGPTRVIVHHALPNALAPIINVVALNLAYLITGVVVVEVVFVYPGLGQLMVDSVAKRDIPVVQAAALIFAAAYILLNLAADVLSTLSNPRLVNKR